MVFSQQEDVQHREKTRARDCYLLGLQITTKIIKKEARACEKSAMGKKKRAKDTES